MRLCAKEKSEGLVGPRRDFCVSAICKTQGRSNVACMLRKPAVESRAMNGKAVGALAMCHAVNEDAHSYFRSKYRRSVPSASVKAHSRIGQWRTSREL